MTKTRAFFKGTRLGRDKLVVVVGRPRSLVIERGMLFGAKKRIKVTRALSSADESLRAFERECAARLQDGWAEIRALIEEQYFDPPVGAMIDPVLQRALIDTARGAPTPKTTKAPRKPAVEVASRGAVLTELVSRGKRVRLEGRLVLPTGRIVAADPMLLSEAPPFERAVAPGAYPVVLSMNDGRVAAATIVLARGVPERWELALPKGMKRLVPPKLRQPAVPAAYGYPVDSATGSFVDASVAGALEDDERAIERLLGPRARNRCHAVGPGPATIAVFQSGRGDGQYGTYFGSRGTEVVCVTTDFGGG